MKNNYTIHSFTFKLGDRIRECVKVIPAGIGAYKIYANSADGELLYIGKSGTVNTDGTFKKQDVRKRLTMESHGVPRQQYFTTQLEQHPEYGQLYMECYILNDTSILPAYLEAYFIQEYYEKNGTLPPWNSSF